MPPKDAQDVPLAPGMTIRVKQHCDSRPRQMWQYEDRLYPNIALNAVAGRAKEDYGVDPVRYEDMLPGCYDAVARLADMDVDGKDRELSLHGVRAYNDFILDEWCPTAPGRYIPLVGLLKIGLSEGGIGWIPYMLERADYSAALIRAQLESAAAVKHVGSELA